MFPYRLSSSSESQIKITLNVRGVGWGGEGEMYGESNMESSITKCKTGSSGNLLYDSGNSDRALYQPRGLRWRGDGRQA